jgi:hypothetical protein
MTKPTTTPTSSLVYDGPEGRIEKWKGLALTEYDVWDAKGEYLGGFVTRPAAEKALGITGEMFG